MPPRASTPTLQLRHADAGTAHARREAALEAALEDAEARFRRLVEQVPAVTYICDFDEAVSVRYISPQIEALTGYAAERWTEDPQFWVSVLHPEDREWVPEEMARCTRDEIPVDFEYRFVAADGSIVHVITESALSEPAVVAPLLERIAELGVKVAIDDFGAGFSSLTRLRHLTVHILKLDRSFLAGVPDDPRGAALIAAMLQLARELDLLVVAEGIETVEHLGHLRAAGASHGQGYHLGRPMPAAELTKLLQA